MCRAADSLWSATYCSPAIDPPRIRALLLCDLISGIRRNAMDLVAVKWTFRVDDFIIVIIFCSVSVLKHVASRQWSPFVCSLLATILIPLLY